MRKKAIVKKVKKVNSPEHLEMKSKQYDSNNKYIFTIIFLISIFILFVFSLIEFSHPLDNNYIKSDIQDISNLILTNSLKNEKISIPSPFYNKSFIDIEISLDYPTKNKVQIVNGSPYISSDIYINSKILSKSNNIDYYTKNNLNIARNFISNYLNRSISSYLYNNSRAYNKDPVGFYKYCDVRNFDWDNHYKNAFFNVNIRTTISY